ncbi:hypothetical protein LJK88_24665 [Paenibacillus sp. P26]|nr:hypothetical protein LJK88_24665 [Paenibacillus sp. P26]UUZ95344.1 hypothetical protein LJK87_13255 [Paenibacillus sp. P25]
MAVVVNFIAINVNTQNRDSTISIGEVVQSGWASHGKNNFGNGNMFGISAAANILNNIIDNDLVDSPIFDLQNAPTAQNQML